MQKKPPLDQSQRSPHSFFSLYCFYICFPAIDYAVYGPTRFLDFRIIDTDERNIPNVTVNIEWEKGGGRQGFSSQEVNYRADGSVVVKWTTLGINAPPQEPIDFIFNLSKMGHKEHEWVFTMQELDREHYVRTEEDMRVYRLPDFVLEKVK